jgi:hypothetical protein
MDPRRSEFAAVPFVIDAHTSRGSLTQMKEAVSTPAASGFWMSWVQRVWGWGPSWPEETWRNARWPERPAGCRWDEPGLRDCPERRRWRPGLQ